MNLTAISTEFGFHPWTLELTTGDVAITPMPNHDRIVADVQSSPGVERDWIYSPPQRTMHLGAGVTESPYPSRVFGLPKTHVLSHSAAYSEDHVAFLIWALSFFTGMRLTSTEAGFVDATPLKPGKLTDFILLGGLGDAIELAEDFWKRNRGRPERARLAAAVVHALFLGQNPLLLQFERFLMLYGAFDACFALAKSLHGAPRHVTHAGRVAWMCGLFTMPLPVWADPGAAAGPEVASMRNETIHEALFMGQPLGFALHGVGTNINITLEMGALICRLVVALLGAPRAEYVTSAVNTRQMQGLRIG